MASGDAEPRNIELVADPPPTEPDTIDLIAAAEERGRRQVRFLDQLNTILSPYAVALQMKTWQSGQEWSWHSGEEASKDAVFPFTQREYHFFLSHYQDPTGNTRPKTLVCEGQATWIYQDKTRAGKTTLPTIIIAMDDRNNIRQILLGHNPEVPEVLWYFINQEGVRDKSLANSCANLGLNLQKGQNFIAVDLTRQYPRIDTWQADYQQVLSWAKEKPKRTDFNAITRWKNTSIGVNQDWNCQGPNGLIDPNNFLGLISTVLNQLPVKNIPTYPGK